MQIKYKQKPINRRVLIQKMFVAACVGVAFGIAACLTFATFGPFIYSFFGIKEKSDIVLQVGGVEEVMPKKDANSSESGNNSGSSSGIKEPLVALYNLGTRTKKSLVGINLYAMEGFEGEDSVQEVSCGILIGHTQEELLILSSPNAVRGTAKAEITFFDGQTVSGKVVSRDPETGLAVISVKISHVPTSTTEGIVIASLGNSNTMDEGQYVISVGNPLGRRQSVVVGNLISNGDAYQVVDSEYMKLETNMMRKTNANGFLLNKSGEMIGVLYEEDDKDCETMCAIGITDYADLLEKMCNATPIPYMGITLRTLTTSTANIYGVSEGVYVDGVVMNSPAMEAGLHEGDIIVGVGKKEIISARQLNGCILGLKPDSTANLTVLRRSKGKYRTITCSVHLGNRQ